MVMYYLDNIFHGLWDDVTGIRRHDVDGALFVTSKAESNCLLCTRKCNALIVSVSVSLIQWSYLVDIQFYSYISSCG